MDNKKPYNKKKKYDSNFKKKKQEEKFDVEKWIKQHSNIEYPKRSKANSLEEYKKKGQR